MSTLPKRGGAVLVASEAGRMTGLIALGVFGCGQAKPPASTAAESAPSQELSASDTTTPAGSATSSSASSPSRDSTSAAASTSPSPQSAATTRSSDSTSAKQTDLPATTTPSTTALASALPDSTAATATVPTDTDSTALPLPDFIRHDIATFANGYYTSAFDVDGDGLRDIAALAAGGSEIVWFQNPTWEQFSITTDVTGVICMEPYDVDADGDLDLAFASEFSMTATSTGGAIQWAEAPDDPLMADSWVLHPIGDIPTAHRVRWLNTGSSANKALAVLPIFGRGSESPEYEGAVQLTTYAQDPSNNGAWVATLLNDSLLEVAHGMSIVDWDGDGVDDILTASNAGVHLFQPTAGTAPVQLGVGAAGQRPDKGSSEVGLGHLGTKRFIATVEPWHGTDLVIYTPGEPMEPWTRTPFGTEFGKGHALLTADLNADGYDEIIAGDQGGQGALLVYRYDTTATAWQRVDFDVGSVAVVGLDVQDINSDGTLDIVAIGGSTNNLVWYENPPAAH